MQMRKLMQPFKIWFIKTNWLVKIAIKFRRNNERLVFRGAIYVPKAIGPNMRIRSIHMQRRLQHDTPFRPSKHGNFSTSMPSERH